jgi:hypothetical protein
MRRTIGLAIALLLLLPLPSRGEGERGKAGSTTVGNMEIVLYVWGPRELVGPRTHASPEPGQQVTHHLDVTVYDQLRRLYIPYLNIRATVLDMLTQREFSVDLEPMIGEWLHYGANIALPHPGRYGIVVTIQPPEIARYKHLADVWNTPARVAFEYTYR